MGGDAMEDGEWGNPGQMKPNWSNLPFHAILNREKKKGDTNLTSTTWVCMKTE
jgi:hypothetical protein